MEKETTKRTNSVYVARTEAIRKLSRLTSFPELAVEEMDESSVFSCYFETLLRNFSILIQLPSLEDDSAGALLSVREKNDIKKAVEFLVGLGIIPLLDVGVVETCWKKLSVANSAEDERRSTFINELFKIAAKNASSTGTKYCDQDQGILSACVDCLFALWSCSTFRTVVSTNFLGYLLASLLQLTSAVPKKKLGSSSKYDNYLQQVIEGSYRPTILRQLMWLQAKKSSIDASGKIPPPRWLSSACGRILSTFLTEPRGILTLLRTFDDSDSDSDRSSLNESWKHCESLATLVATPPRSAAGILSDAYYDNVCLQLITDKEISNRYYRFFVIAVRKLYTKCPGVAVKRILEPNFAVLRQCFDPGLDAPAEEQLTEAVDYLKLLYTSSPVEELFVESLPLDVGIILLWIYFFIKNSASYCRMKTKEIISAYLKNASSNSAVLLAKHWILMEHEVVGAKQRRRICFSPGSLGGIAASAGDIEEVMDIQRRIEFMQQIIGELPKESQANIFENLLNLLRCEHDCRLEPSTSGGGAKALESCDELAMLGFMVSLIEMDSSICHRKRLLQLLKALLERNSHGDGHDEDLESVKSQNVLLIIGILGTLFSTSDSAMENTDELLEFLPVLHELSETHGDINVRTAAKDCHFAIFTSKNATDEQKPSSSATNSSQRHYNQTSYEEALVDLRNPVVPVRTHGLVRLTKLINSKDSATCSNLDALIPVVVDLLEEDDAYVYLAAVNCLSAAGLYRPHVVLPVLMAIFKGNDDRRENVERRLKVAEAIVKISRGLGDLAPFYGNDLINLFLSLLHNGDDTIKASCLSNLAEICRLMSFKLNIYICELFHCAKQLLQWDESGLVRRAAINLLSLLTESGDEFLQVLGDLSRDFYRFVKNVYEHDADDVVRLHAQKCLENLGEHAKKFLNPLILSLD